MNEKAHKFPRPTKIDEGQCTKNSHRNKGISPLDYFRIMVVIVFIFVFFQAKLSDPVLNDDEPRSLI